MMTFNGQNNEDVLEESKDLRKEFQIVMRLIIKNLYEEMERQFENWSIADYKQYKPTTHQ